MSGFLSEPLAWYALLSRPAVLLQLLSIALLLLAALPLRRHSARLGRLPWGIPLLPALALLGFGLAVTGQRWGLVWLVAQLVLAWLGLRLLETQVLRRLLPPELYGVLVSRMLRPLFLLGVGLLLLDALDSLQTVADLPLGVWLGSSIQLGQLAWVSTLLYLVVVGSALPAAWLSWLAQRGLQLGDGGRRALELVIRYVLVALAVLWAFNALGINQTGLLAVAGGLSVGLGFGIKEVFSNFVSGLWLLFEGSVRPGEVLMIDGDPCEVRKLGLRATLLWRDRDNAELLIPNQVFFTEAATTYTASDRMRRSQVSVGAAYHHDPSAVIALLEATALSVPRVLKHPAPKGLLLSYGDSAINYALRFWIANPMDNVGICSEVNQAIWSAFKQHNIEIPFPQQVEYSMVWPPERQQPNIEKH